MLTSATTSVACVFTKYLPNRNAAPPARIDMLHFLANTAVVLAVLVADVSLLENGLARTPPMGWMSWGYYECADKCEENPDKCLDEKLILSVVDSFYKEGYQEAGYEYIIIDDCWSERHRDSNGRLVPDRKRFPRGMRFIADYIHERGLKFGMYTNIASDTCMRYPGSKDHFDVDAASFAEWGADYIKVDGCFVTEEFLDKAYIKLGHHLNQTGRPMVYSCSWPYYKVYIHNHKPDYNAIMPLCNLWRNYHDVQKNWVSVSYILDFYETHYPELHKYHGPGHWNDPDMLILGTGALTPAQARIQIAVYAMLSAPLLISCPMENITDYERSLLLNLDLLAIGQDPLGIMAEPRKVRNTPSDVTMWVKRHLPMKGDIYHSISVAFVNLNPSNQYVSVPLARLGANCTDGYSVMDVFAQVFPRNITLNDTIDAVIPPQDVLLYKFFPL